MPNEEMPLVCKTQKGIICPDNVDCPICPATLQQAADLAILKDKTKEAYERGKGTAEARWGLIIIPNLLRAERLKEAEWLERWLGAWLVDRLPRQELKLYIASLKGDGGN